MWRRQTFRFIRNRQLRKIAKQVRAGIVPVGVDQETIFKALKLTQPRHMEAFGILSAKVFRNGEMIQDLGIQGVKEVTAEAVKYIVDAMTDSSVAMDEFTKHAMGDGSTAETDSETGLVNQIDGRNVGSQTHGASSNIYRSVATITAGSAYTAIEHGIFDSTGTGDDVMLDRTIVGTPPTLATDDEVEWTYDLTINAGG